MLEIFPAGDDAGEQTDLRLRVCDQTEQEQTHADVTTLLTSVWGGRHVVNAMFYYVIRLDGNVLLRNLQSVRKLKLRVHFNFIK